ncbi:MAG: hypothetical protein F8N39_11710 [Clostridiaceae bacterium]|nr:hypothetical protein [Clostridiaceae bacterium]
MGRYFSGGAGGVGAGGSVTPAITTTVTAGESVQQGDIITIGDDTLAYWAADPTNGALLNALRPVSSPIPQAGAFLNASLIRPRTSVGAPAWVAQTGAPALGATAYDAAQMADGNLVCAWVSATSGAVMGAIFDQTGVQIGDTRVLDAFASWTATSPVLSLDALTGGGFALSYYVAPPAGTTPGAGAMKYGVYDAALAPVLAPTVADPAVTGGNGQALVYIYVRRLSSGGFVIAYLSQAPDLIQAVRTYDAKGALTGGPVSLGGTAGGGSWGIHCDSFTAATGGGFVVTYYNQTGSMVRKFSNTCGPLMDASQVSGFNSPYNRVAVLAGGGFAVAMANGTVTTYGANCKQIAASVPYMTSAAASGNDAAGVYPPAICSHPDGNFAVFNFGSGRGTTSGFARFSGVAGQVLATGPASVSAGWNSGAVSMIAPLQGGGSVVVAGGGLWVLDAAAGLVGAPGLPSGTYVAQGSPGVLKPISNTAKKTDLYLLMTQSLSLALIAGYLQSYSPLGVAAAPAVAGGSVPVQITGNATIRLSFARPYAVDATGSPTPGQRMMVAGNQAILHGLQSATRSSRPIN